jgi:DNA-binding XRE family transcriptional regulator
MRRRQRTGKLRGRASKGRTLSGRSATGRATSTKHHRETARFRRLADLVARKLRALRRDRGMTIDAASEAAGVEPMTWYRLENRKANPTLAVLASLAAVFGLSVSAFLDDDG